jgi:hypothetical protein
MNEAEPHGRKQTRAGISVSAPSVVKANNKGVCVVTVRVTNGSSSSQSILVSLSTGDSKKVSVGAGKTATVTLTATPVKDTKCTVKASCSAGTRTCMTTLKPMFVL